MYKIDHCPACHSTNVTKFPAYMYEFIEWRITKQRPNNRTAIQGIKCNDCDFTCSDTRFDQQDETNLYDGYRNSLYDEMRIACEPSYAHHLQNFNEQEYHNIRSFGINTLIDKYLNKPEIKTVLDYGGDKGQHIPESLSHAERYVYDISNVELMPNIKQFDPATTDKMDFVMCCHVLEHKSEPDEIINEIAKYVHKDTWLYVEVPEYEMYGPNSSFHEHINSFTDRSMWALLNRCNFEYVDAITTQYKDGYIMCVMARPKPELFENTK